MGDYLNIGNAGFTAITKGLYVDKTDMISYINRTLGTTDKLTCVSRPRRFGKSFAAKMLCAYYDKSCDSEALFADYKIADDPSWSNRCEKHCKRYPGRCDPGTLRRLSEYAKAEYFAENALKDHG